MHSHDKPISRLHLLALDYQSSATHTPTPTVAHNHPQSFQTLQYITINHPHSSTLKPHTNASSNAEVFVSWRNCELVGCGRPQHWRKATGENEPATDYEPDGDEGA